MNAAGVDGLRFGQIGVDEPFDDVEVVQRVVVDRDDDVVGAGFERRDEFLVASDVLLGYLYFQPPGL